MPAAETALTNLLAHCCNVKAAAIAAGANNSHCLTIARYLGKAILQLEALYQVEGVAGPSDDILDDFFDAVNAISDTVSFVSHMSRLQALFQAEDIRDGLKAAAADLRAAVATLAPMHSYFPPDAKEDFTTLERQLASMRLGTRPNGILAAQELLWALTLHEEGVILTATSTATTAATDSANTASPPLPCISLDTALQNALSQSGLASVSAEIWLDNELAALARGILEGLHSEPIDAFHLACAAMALLHAASMGRLYLIEEKNSSNNSSSSNGEKTLDQKESIIQEEGKEEEDAKWRKILLGEKFGVNSSELSSSDTRVLLASTFNLTRKTRKTLETALAAVGKFTKTEEKLCSDDFTGLCQALSCSPCLDTENVEIGDKCSSNVSYSMLLRQYKAAVLLSHAAEHQQGATKLLLEAGAIPTILAALENNNSNNNTSVRIAAATALRHLCRDSSAREAAAVAGCLRPIARLLQSQHAAPRRAAARAFGNIVVAGEGYKREAVEKYSIPGSLIAMLRSDDALGQEAAALALSNLAANSEIVQAALGKTDVFNPLSEVLHTAIGMTSTSSMYNSAAVAVAQHAAARAVRNLTSRVQFNRLKASAAGTVPGLVALLHSPDPEGRALGAAALATVMDGCSDALSQAVHAGATTELIKILQDDSNLACRDAAACAVVHIIQSNVLQHHYNHSTAATATTTTTTATTSTTTTGTGTILATREPASLVGIGISTSVLPALVGLLSTGTPLARRASARLLVFLAKYKSKDAVVAAGAVTHLVPLLSAKHDAVRREAATALCALMHRCDAARIQFLEAQGMPLLIALLKKKSQPGTNAKPAPTTGAGGSNPQLVGDVEESTRQEAARALGILCANNTTAVAAAKAGAIEALVNILKQGKESNSSSTSSSSFASAAQEAAAVALSNLACPPSNQTALADAGAGQVLLCLLRDDSPVGCRVAAARGLSNMMADGLPEELKRAVSDLVQLLTELAIPTNAGDKNKKSIDELILNSRNQNNHAHNDTHHGHHHNEHEHQIAAACALGNLACADSHGALAVAKYGGAAVLAQLCRSEVPSVREAAAQGLWESCRGSPEARHVAAVQQEVVPWLCQILTVGEDPAKEAAAGCLAELTRCGEIVCAAAEEAGAPLLLQRLADHGTVDVAGAAAAALKALKRRSPDSPSLEHELSQRLSSFRELGSRRFDSGGEEEEEEEEEEAGKEYDEGKVDDLNNQ